MLSLFKNFNVSSSYQRIHELQVSKQKSELACLQRLENELKIKDILEKYLSLALQKYKWSQSKTILKAYELKTLTNPNHYGVWLTSVNSYLVGREQKIYPVSTFINPQCRFYIGNGQDLIKSAFLRHYSSNGFRFLQKAITNEKNNSILNLAQKDLLYNGDYLRAKAQSQSTGKIIRPLSSDEFEFIYKVRKFLDPCTKTQLAILSQLAKIMN